MRIDEYCYWCGKPATTRDHVPPKCLFPEYKDINEVYGKNFRNNLITVPSCKKHNLSKSNDDEYLMACLGARVGNNGIAFVHAHTKIKRTLERHPYLLKVEKDTTLIIGKQEFAIQIIKANNIRLMHSFEAIARALYFYEYKKQYNGDCMIVSKIFFSPEYKFSTIFNYRSVDLIEMEQPLWNTTINGNNPQIFTYQFSPRDGFGTRTLALTFYETIKAYACLYNKSKLEKYKPKFDS